MSFLLESGGGACASHVRVYRISRSPDAPSARIVPDTIDVGPMGEMRRPVEMERAKHGLFGHTLGSVVILRYHELR